MNFQKGFYAGLLVAAAWGVWLALLWQPERQVQLHSAHLLTAVENHDWKAVGDFVGSEYQDRWTNDRARLLQRLRDLFRMLPNAD